MSEHAAIRILSVDDHPVLQQGIAAMIHSQPDMELVAEARNGREAAERFREHHPDVTLMDLRLPDMNGIDAIIAIRKEFPDARIIVLTTFEGDAEIQRALEAGARAYLLKSMTPRELLDGIRHVRAGRKRPWWQPSPSRPASPNDSRTSTARACATSSEARDLRWCFSTATPR